MSEYGTWNMRYVLDGGPSLGISACLLGFDGVQCVRTTAEKWKVAGL